MTRQPVTVDERISACGAANSQIQVAKRIKERDYYEAIIYLSSAEKNYRKCASEEGVLMARKEKEAIVNDPRLSRADRIRAVSAARDFEPVAVSSIEVERSSEGGDYDSYVPEEGAPTLSRNEEYEPYIPPEDDPSLLQQFAGAINQMGAIASLHMAQRAGAGGWAGMAPSYGAGNALPGYSSNPSAYSGSLPSAAQRTQAAPNRRRPVPTALACVTYTPVPFYHNVSGVFRNSCPVP
jgi:hypothetical protein